MSVPNTTYRSFVEKLGNTPASEFIGEEGDLFWNPETGSLRVSDGSTPGGIAASATGTQTLGISTAGLASIAYVNTKVGQVTAAGISTSFVSANGVTFEIVDGLIIGMS